MRICFIRSALLILMCSTAACVPSTPAAAAPQRSNQALNLPAYCRERPGEWADSLRVRPPRIELRVGQTYPISALQVVRAGTADSLAHTPMDLQLGSPVVKLEQGALHALTSGEAVLYVRPLCRSVQEGRAAVPAANVSIVVSS